MRIIVAKRAGFCFGVKRAVNIAFDMASRKEKVCTLGPIIHNPQVVESLKQNGVNYIDEPTMEDGTIIIRTHGIPVDQYKRIEKMGLEIVDATCPFVKKAQQYAKLLSTEGYQVILLGDRDHPEVKSIMSFAGNDVVVVKDGEIPLNIRTKVGIVVQTTQPVDALRRLLSEIIEKTKELKIYNTICNSTALRLKETFEISGSVNLMLVVGGKNSANTSQLANLCRSNGVNTRHIETASEIQTDWFHNVESVGVTAGASTPDWIIEEIKAKIDVIASSNAA